MTSLSVYPASDEFGEELRAERGIGGLDPHPELRGAYAASKIHAERALHEEAQSQAGPHVAVVRPGLVFGPGMAGALAGTAAMAPLRLAIVQGSASQRVPVIAIDDLCRGLRVFVATADPWPKRSAYDVLGKEAPTKAEFLELYGHCSGQHPRLVRMPEPVALLGPRPSTA